MSQFTFEDDVVCHTCGSDHIHVNMFYQVWSREWHGDPDCEVWCNKCGIETGWIPREDFEKEEEK